MSDEVRALAQGLADAMNLGKVCAAQTEPLGADEQGFSGAQLARLRVFFADGRQGSMILKRAGCKERNVMQRLTEQNRRHTPAAFTFDRTSDAPEWMIQEDFGRRVAASGDRAWMTQVADVLAGLHADNLEKIGEMPWLPKADGAYWQEVTHKLSVDHFERRMSEDASFCRHYGRLLPALRKAGEEFAKDMADLSEWESCMTLTHGDLQDLGGDHVYNVQGKPKVIDFGFARYAPLFIDLVDYFSWDERELCYRALAGSGVFMSRSDFDAGFRAAQRYPGFIYLFPSLMHERAGSAGHLLRRLRIILGSDAI